jgi:uncharacterized protein (TIGR02246 family)
MKHEGAIRELASAVDAAFNAGDSTTMASHWAEDGLNIDPFGDAFEGRVNIQNDLHESLNGFMKGSKHELAISKVYSVNEQVAVADGIATVAGIVFPGGHALEPFTSNFTMICSKSADGHWQIAQLRAYKFLSR